mmetsp:Transcript_63213/g.87877  ORF Transcript_63213/g.87877 Transcript_63213/m.87877 type:complete len:101 (-) Transcript_63213:73-375(-)
MQLLPVRRQSRNVRKRTDSHSLPKTKKQQKPQHFERKPTEKQPKDLSKLRKCVQLKKQKQSYGMLRFRSSAEGWFCVLFNEMTATTRKRISNSLQYPRQP